MEIEPNKAAVEDEVRRLWFRYRANLLVERAMRIAIAGAILAYTYGSRGKLVNLVTKPIAHLSIADIGTIIGYVILGLALFVFAWWMAIGSHWGPIASSSEVFRQHATEYQRRIETYSAKHPILGRLRYPTLGVNPPWKAALIRFVICVALTAVSAISTWISWPFSQLLSICLLSFTVVVMMSAVFLTFVQLAVALVRRHLEVRSR